MLIIIIILGSTSAAKADHCMLIRSIAEGRAQDHFLPDTLITIKQLGEKHCQLQLFFYINFLLSGIYVTECI